MVANDHSNLEELLTALGSAIYMIIDRNRLIIWYLLFSKTFLIDAHL